jgi:hypothetical protein
LGPNSAEEALPIHKTFSSDAKQEENNAMNAAWIVGLLHVIGQSCHVEVRSYPASASAMRHFETCRSLKKIVFFHFLNIL